MRAPVILFVYNRIEHTKMVLQALDANEDADKSELYIFSDAPRNHFKKANIIVQKKTRNLIKEGINMTPMVKLQQEGILV